MSIIALIALMIIDYVLTYIGTTKKFITEANILMKSFMKLKFKTGLIARLAYCIILVGLPLYLLRTYVFYYKLIISIGFVVNIIIMILHARWITKYLKH